MDECGIRDGMEKDIILDSIADGVFTVDDNWFITSFNRAAEQITGVSREEAIGQHCKDVLTGDVSVEEKLRKTIAERYSFEDIISKNHRMHQLFDILPDVADSVSTVLLEGESGTGKELFARAIHHLSPRKKQPFIAVNCGALPDTLLESELFGSKAGAFTDAKKDKPGRCRLAERGTLFLDEVGDISTDLQVRLLRGLQGKR